MLIHRLRKPILKLFKNPTIFDYSGKWTIFNFFIGFLQLILSNADEVEFQLTFVSLERMDKHSVDGVRVHSMFIYWTLLTHFLAFHVQKPEPWQYIFSSDAFNSRNLHFQADSFHYSYNPRFPGQYSERTHRQELIIIWSPVEVFR